MTRNWYDGLRQIGHWTIERKIGEGHTAAVFRARKGGQVAAVKVYKPEFAQDEDDIERFERQLKLKGHRHPHLVKILEGAVVGEYRYLVMEQVPGDSLDRLIASLPVYRIQAILAQIASAAHFLEERGIVHRDIKPSNIIVDTLRRSATLVDLGVIRPIITSSDVSLRSGENLGTLRYTPHEFLERDFTDPERLKKKPIPEAAYRALTFYQLGAVAYELITGNEFLKDLLGKDDGFSTILDKIKAHAYLPNLSPDNLRQDVPAELVDLTRRCLVYDWKARVSINWSDFARSLFVRKPIVVLLYTGGTIGAKTENDDPTTRKLRQIADKNDSFLVDFQHRIERDYRQFAGPDVRFPFELEWDVLPPDQQLFSENATYKTWEHLGSAIKRICDGYTSPHKNPLDDDTYLAGVVVLHGTDTLAYSAAALSFSLQNLPCPVVLTGSNQPPSAEDLRENVITSKSDAWKNVLRSLQFIQTFGHRFTEVFVCFSDTVHIAVNLRKSAIERSTLTLRQQRNMLQEPYFYRNRGPIHQYAYRIIDGLYCNNLYPLSPTLRYDNVIENPMNVLGHVRRNLWSPQAPVHQSMFADGVRLLGASPSALLPDEHAPEQEHSPMDRAREYFAAHLHDDLEQVKVLIIEGFNSGTIPTDPGHPLHPLLVKLQRRSIPIVLVTRNGLVPSPHHYEMAMVSGEELPILRLFGMIAETATPFLSMILNEIHKDTWDHIPADPATPSEIRSMTESSKLLEYRHELLRNTIRIHTDQRGLFRALLGNVTDQVEQQQRLESEIRDRESEHGKRVTGLFSHAKAEEVSRPEHSDQQRPARTKSPQLTRTTRHGFDEVRTIFHRQHFLWMLGEVVYTHDGSHAGPDGLSFLNELGFVWGAEVRKAVLDGDHKSEELFASQSPERQTEFLERASQQVAQFTRIIYDHGIAHTEEKPLLIDPPTEEGGNLDGRLTLELKTTKHGKGGRDDELFAALGYRKSEAQFFKSLREGCELTYDPGEFPGVIEKRFNELFKNTFAARVSPLDWFLIGAYKALVTGILLDLRFDPWIERCDRETEPDAIDALRQSIHTEVLSANSEYLHLKMTYTSRPFYSWPG